MIKGSCPSRWSAKRRGRRHPGINLSSRHTATSSDFVFGSRQVRASRCSSGGRDVRSTGREVGLTGYLAHPVSRQTEPGVPGEGEIGASRGKQVLAPRIGVGLRTQRYSAGGRKKVEKGDRWKKGDVNSRLGKVDAMSNSVGPTLLKIRSKCRR